MLAKREVIYIDISQDLDGCNPLWDPKTFQSKTTGRGPLVGPQWWEVRPRGSFTVLVFVENRYTRNVRLQARNLQFQVAWSSNHG